MRFHHKLMCHIEVNTPKQVAANDEQKVGKIDHFFRTEKNSTAVVLSKIVAIEGLQIHLLAKCQCLRAELEAQGYHFPIDEKEMPLQILLLNYFVVCSRRATKMMKINQKKNLKNYIILMKDKLRWQSNWNSPSRAL